MKTLKELNEGKLDEASSDTVKAIKLIGELAEAFKDLAIDITDAYGDSPYEDTIEKDYPFGESFDDLNIKVQKWATQSIKNIKKM